MCLISAVKWLHWHLGRVVGNGVLESSYRCPQIVLFVVIIASFVRKQRLPVCSVNIRRSEVCRCDASIRFYCIIPGCFHQNLLETAQEGHTVRHGRHMSVRGTLSSAF